MQTLTISTPDNLTISQNGNPPQPPSSELEKLLQATTTLTVWLIFLAIGGGLLARYYLRINYLPEMEWNAALVYLFVCSVWGGVIGLLLTISLYLPGVIWCEIIIFETTLDNQLTYFGEHDEPSGKRSIRKEPCIRSIIRYLGAPFFAALIISHFCLLTSTQDIKPLDFVFWALAVVLLAFSFFGMRQIFRGRIKPETYPDDKRKTISRQIFRYSIWFTLSVLLNQISMYVIYRLADRTPNLTHFLILTGLCPLIVCISTQVVAVRHRYYPRQAVVAALVAAGLLLFTADQFSDLSMKLMRRYGIGEDKRFNLLVKPELIPLLKSEGVQTCGQQHVCNVEILSKIGDHFFVRVDREVDKKVVGRLEITLPKSEVIAIRRL
jgi:hypothetical protein